MGLTSVWSLESPTRAGGKGGASLVGAHMGWKFRVQIKKRGLLIGMEGRGTGGRGLRVLGVRVKGKGVTHRGGGQGGVGLAGAHMGQALHHQLVLPLDLSQPCFTVAEVLGLNLLCLHVNMTSLITMICNHDFLITMMATVTGVMIVLIVITMTLVVIM